MSSNPLAIVGMRRSGTSSLCLALNLLGVSFGEPDQLFRGDSSNEEGYWEHRALIGLHRSFRMSLNLRSVDCDPTPIDWRERPASEHFIDQGTNLLKKHFLQNRGPWAWKDPDASLALPFVYGVAAKIGISPLLLICVRNPVDVARSEMKRNGTPELETVGAWLAHTLTALHDSIALPSRVIHFADFLNDPRKVLAPSLRDMELSPTEKQWEDALASVRTDLVHNKAGDDGLGALPPLVRRVYELCLVAASEGVTSVEREVDSCWLEFESFRQMFWRPALEKATLGALWERRGESQYTQVLYRPSEGWQTVRVETGALPGSSVQIYLYPLPANVWIRRAIWQCREKLSEAVIESGRAGNLRKLFGLWCVSLLHGPDHIIVKAPLTQGAYVLELDILIESNNLVIGETYKLLSETCLGNSDP